MSAISALVLAGSVNHIPLHPGYVPAYKSTLRLAGRPSIQYVVEALAAVPGIAGITVVGPCTILANLLADCDAARGVSFTEGGEELISSLRYGLEAMPDTDPVLVTTGDLPLLTPGAVVDFLTACRETAHWNDPSSVFLAVVPRWAYRRAYAHFTKPFNHFRDVTICHGNLAIIHPRLLENGLAMDCLQKLYEVRKRPVASALSTGLHIGLEFLLGVDVLHVLTLEHVARTISQELHLRLIPVLLDHPEVTIDVDDADDYRFVMEQLQQKGSFPIRA